MIFYFFVEGGDVHLITYNNINSIRIAEIFMKLISSVDKQKRIAKFHLLPKKIVWYLCIYSILGVCTCISAAASSIENLFTFNLLCMCTFAMHINAIL